jgi:hypothetical protein
MNPVPGYGPDPCLPGWKLLRERVDLSLRSWEDHFVRDGAMVPPHCKAARETVASSEN